jgi:hypothetical protein
LRGRIIVRSNTRTSDQLAHAQTGSQPRRGKLCPRLLGLLTWINAVQLALHDDEGSVKGGADAMPEPEPARELDELDRLPNDPDVPLDPHKIWSLLSDMARRRKALAAAEEMNDPARPAAMPNPEQSPPQVNGER